MIICRQNKVLLEGILAFHTDLIMFNSTHDKVIINTTLLHIHHRHRLVLTLPPVGQ